MIEERLAGGQKAHSARRSSEERGTDFVLEGADLAADRRLRDVKALGGAADMALLGDGDEIADLSEAHASSVPCSRSRSKALARQIETVLDARAQRSHGCGMAIEILSAAEIERMRRAGRGAAEPLAFIGSQLRPGISTAEIDRWVREDTARRGGRPSQLGYKGFPAAVCTSRNEVVCHGVPSTEDVLKDGDIVNLDITLEKDGFIDDSSKTYLIGNVHAPARRLVRTTYEAMWRGIRAVRPGARLGDIGHAIERHARQAGYSVVRDYCGHGIGREMHEDPQILRFGKAGTGLALREGMTFTIEPMLNQGGRRVDTLDDGWTVVTEDGKLSAQFEHTVAVTKTGVRVLTLRPDEAGAAGRLA